RASDCQTLATDHLQRSPGRAWLPLSRLTPPRTKGLGRLQVGSRCQRTEARVQILSPDTRGQETTLRRRVQVETDGQSHRPRHVARRGKLTCLGDASLASPTSTANCVRTSISKRRNCANPA